MKTTVVILAAGDGTRFNGNKPKVLHEIAGRPMLAHVLDQARAAGADDIHVVVGDHADAMRAAADDDTLHWHHQAERLGTAHALQCAGDALAGSEEDDVVLVLYGDVPYVRPDAIQSLLARLEDADLALLTKEEYEPAGYGRIIRDDDGRVVCIVEELDAIPDEVEITEISTGILAARGGCLPGLLERIDNDNAQDEYYLTDCVGLAVADGLRVVTADADGGDDDIESDTRHSALGVNTPRQLEEAERAYQWRLAEQLMAQGVTLRDRRRFDVRGEVRCGRDVVIDVNVVLEGNVALGDDVRVGANCVLRDVELGDGTQVEPFSIIESSRTGRRCTIGPFARIRPETELDDEVKIGNFVEIKKSTIGAGSKVNHLSYVGDTGIGRSVNVGAGTVTCNYDGAQKHRTVIGDDVFIGSGAQLVAPVKIGDGATIGAGSTITRDAEADTLTLSRAEQKTVPGWKRPGGKEHRQKTK